MSLVGFAGADRKDKEHFATNFMGFRGLERDFLSNQ